MKSIVIKKLDELELKAAALAQTRQKKLKPPAPRRLSRSLVFWVSSLDWRKRVSWHMTCLPR